MAYTTQSTFYPFQPAIHMSGSYFSQRAELLKAEDQTLRVSSHNVTGNSGSTTNTQKRPTTASLSPNALLPPNTAARSILQRCRTPVNDPIALCVDYKAMKQHDSTAVELMKKPLWDKSLGAARDGGRVVSPHLSLSSISQLPPRAATSMDVLTASALASSTMPTQQPNASMGLSRTVTAQEFHTMLGDSDRKIATGGYVMANRTRRLINNVACVQGGGSTSQNATGEPKKMAVSVLGEQKYKEETDDEQAWAKALHDSDATLQLKAIEQEYNKSAAEKQPSSLLTNMGYRPVSANTMLPSSIPPPTQQAQRPPSAIPLDKANKVATVDISGPRPTSALSSLNTISRQCYEASPVDLRPRKAPSSSETIGTELKEGTIYGELPRHQASKRPISAVSRFSSKPAPKSVFNKWAKEGARAVRGTNSESVEVLAAAPSFVSAEMMRVRREGYAAEDEISDFYQYTGDVVNGIRQGQGTFIVKGAAVIRGTFENGEVCGKGVKQWPDGSMYEGYFLKGEPHGLGGTYVGISNGEYYEGGWRFGLRDGYGVLKKHPVMGGTDQSSKKEDAAGPAALPSTFTYKGYFVNGKMEDTNGLLIDNVNQSDIRGHFKGGLPHGNVVITSRITGDVFDGAAEFGFPSCVKGTLLSHQRVSDFSVLHKVWELIHDDRQPKEFKLTSTSLAKLHQVDTARPSMLVRYCGPFAEAARLVSPNAVIPLSVSILPPVNLPEVSVLGPAGVAALLSGTTVGLGAVPVGSVSRVGSDLSPSSPSLSIEHPVVMVTSPNANSLPRSISPASNVLTPANQFLFSATKSGGLGSHLGGASSVPSYCIQPSIRSRARSSVAPASITPATDPFSEDGPIPLRSIPIDRYCLRFHPPSILAEHIPKEAVPALEKERELLSRYNPFIDVFLPVVVGSTINLKVGLGAHPLSLPHKPPADQSRSSSVVQSPLSRKKSTAAGGTVGQAARSSRAAVVTIEDAGEAEAAAQRSYEDASHYNNVMGLLNPYHNYNNGLGTSISGSTAKVRRMSARKSIAMVAAMLSGANVGGARAPSNSGRGRNLPGSTASTQPVPSRAFAHPLVRGINGLTLQRPFRSDEQEEQSSIRPSWAVFESAPSSPKFTQRQNLQTTHLDRSLPSAVSRRKTEVGNDRSLVQHHSTETGRRLSVYLLGVPPGTDPYSINPTNCTSCTLLPEESIDPEAFQAAIVDFYKKMYATAAVAPSRAPVEARKKHNAIANQPTNDDSSGPPTESKRIFGNSRAQEVIKDLDLVASAALLDAQMQNAGGVDHGTMLNLNKKSISLRRLRSAKGLRSGPGHESLPECLKAAASGVSGSITSVPSLHATILPQSTVRSATTTVANTSFANQRLSTTSASSSLIGLVTAGREPLSGVSSARGGTIDWTFARSHSATKSLPAYHGGLQKSSSTLMPYGDAHIPPALTEHILSPGLVRIAEIAPTLAHEIIPPVCGPKEKASANITVRIPPTLAIGTELHVLYICADDPVVKVTVNEPTFESQKSPQRITSSLRSSSAPLVPNSFFVAIKPHATPDDIKREGELAFKVASVWKGFVAGRRPKTDQEETKASPNTPAVLRVGFAGEPAVPSRRANSATTTSSSSLWQSPFSGGKSLVVTQDGHGEDLNLRLDLPLNANVIRPLIIPLYIKHLQPTQIEILSEAVSKRKSMKGGDDRPVSKNRNDQESDVEDRDSEYGSDQDGEEGDFDQEEQEEDPKGDSDADPHIPPSAGNEGINIVVIGVDE